MDYVKGAYPKTTDFIASHVYLTQIAPPNDDTLMAKYVEAVAKVLENAEELV